MYIYTSKDFGNEARILAGKFGETYAEFKEGCFQDIREHETRITFIGHGTKDEKDDNIEFGDGFFSSDVFAEKIINYGLPKNIKTIDFIACYLGLLQDKPTYLASFSEKLSKKGYEIEVRGITYKDLEKKYPQMSMSLLTNEQGDKDRCIALVFTKDQQEARKRHDEIIYTPLREKSQILGQLDFVKKQLSNMEGLKKEIDELNQLTDEEYDQNKYDPNREDNLTTRTECIQHKQAELDHHERQRQTLESRRVELQEKFDKKMEELMSLSERYKEESKKCGDPLIFFSVEVDHFRDELDTERYLVPVNSVEIQRAEITNHNEAAAVAMEIEPPGNNQNPELTNDNEEGEEPKDPKRRKINTTQATQGQPSLPPELLEGGERALRETLETKPELQIKNDPTQPDSPRPP